MLFFFVKLEVRLKRFLSLISALVLSTQLYASHIVGGDMYYDCLGGNTYQITLKIYRDCLSDGADFDPVLPVTVFNGLNVQIDQFTIPYPGSVTLDVLFDNPCITLPSDICVEEAIYQKTVTLPDSPTGYTLSYQRCCRGPAVTNLNDPDDEGLTLQIDIPPTSFAVCNSSARFTNYPPLVLCSGQEIEFDHSAIDPDGDFLVYELCSPFGGGSSVLPAPDPASPPPYDPVVWGPGFSATDPFGDGDLTIDPVTGMVTALPEAPGLYAVGVCVNEYRDGNLISTSRRDFLFKVLNCDIELEAEVVLQEELTTFVSFCQGLEIFFENNSYGGEFYKWDFGVSGIGTDISSEFEPSYTFPGPGTYEVMLVVNPGWPCTDTSFATFIVANEITAFFTSPDAQCIVDNSFDFMGEGVYPAEGDGTTFEWNLGGSSIPLFSTVEDPTGVVFTEGGPHNVTFTVNYDVCTISYTEEVFVYAEPTINFTVPDELKCAPYTAYFNDLSFAHTEIFYSWDFGDGIGTSDEQHPVYVYNEVGVYDVTLTIWTIDGCIDTLTLMRENLIEIFPSPTSNFTVTPDIQDEYHADFFFTDHSVDGVEQWFYFADGDFSSETEVWHNYTEPGVYYPWQIVINEYGCKDRTYQQVTVIPVMPVLVPNTFTPDGNELNNIFKPVFYDDENQIYHMLIYNRWGELIYDFNGAGGSWDGSYNGVVAPDGVYIWKIIYNEYDTGLPTEIGGHVTLLR
tara:strand:- start:17126 stop:19336 length:2211 start_codon:yes stop_codon:yes gene_type:complete